MSTRDPFSTTPEPAPEVREQGREVAGHARSEVEDTASHAADKAREVAGTAKSEMRDVVDEARDVVRRQADEQTRAAAGGLSKLTDDLRAMSGGGAPSDTTARYLEQAASSLEDIVDRLDRDGIEGALSGMRNFARRSPGAFLLASAGAGFAMGRLIRNADRGPTGDAEGDVEIDLTDSAMGSHGDPLAGSSPATTVPDSRYDVESNRIYADPGTAR